MTTDTEAIREAIEAFPDAHKKHGVYTRGRPERDERDTARRELRRGAFGSKFRKLRESTGMSLVKAAALAGMTSSRKLAQYETTCYPPGEVVARLAPHYGVSVEDLCGLLLKHSDPALYTGMTGKPGYEVEEFEIDDHIARMREKGDK